MPYPVHVADRTWQLQEAKNHLSEVVALAMKEGAQTITKHGKPAVVVVSVEEYEQSRAPRRSLFTALRECPEGLSGIVGRRSKEPAREVRFGEGA